MGHPMAKNGNRKRGDKFVKPQKRWSKTEQENEINQAISEEEKSMNDQYIMDIESR